MSDSRLSSTASDGQRLKSLLAQQAEIQAQIASLLPDHPTPQHHRSPIHKPQQQQQQQRRRSNVPRSYSTSGTPMGRRLSSDRPEAPAMRSRTISQRSAPAMVRVNSRGGASQQSNLSFAPGPMSQSLPSENPAMEAWTRDQPLSSYTFSHSLSHRSMSQRQRELPQVPELDFGEDPAAFLTRTGFPAVTITPSPITIPQPRHSSINARGYSMSPSTPLMESMTEGTTYGSNMSRSNSICNDPLVEGMRMVKCSSNKSYPPYTGDQAMYDATPPATSLHTRRASNDEQSLLLVGAGGASHSQFPQSLPSDFPPTAFGAKMEKSMSNESISSSSSSASRSKMRLHAAIAQQARPLMPKGGDDNAMSRGSSSQSMVRLESKDGAQDKLLISKPTTYQRPKRDRVLCKQCDSYPCGFRGEHELRRHQEREHQKMVKKWVCVEPTSAGHLKPVHPLSKCKACSKQKKKYGAYYNAAAHLRRAHFNPKPKGRGKNSKNDEASKRGGKGGGDWPSMSVLKAWMAEVEEPANLFSTANEEEEEADESENETSDDFFDTLSTQEMDAYPIYNDSSMLDYSQVSSDNYTMQSMQFLPPSQVQVVDMSTASIFDNTSQSTFDDFSPVLMTSPQNDQPLAFYDLPHTSFLPPQSSNTFDDQLVGIDGDVPFYPYPLRH